SGSRGMVVAIVHGAFNGGHAFFAYSLGMVAASTGFMPAFWIACGVTLSGAALLGLQRSKTPSLANAPSAAAE
ncbi:MAG: hypothetical protein AAGF12_43500, partial [Myxococcota bacterium]